MPDYDPEQFWSRFRTLAEKDLPVILQTDIKQSTLSTWRTDKTYPRADDAVKIAAALQTTVEYLVTGSDKARSPLDPTALEIALTAAKLSRKGQQTLLYVAKGLLTQLPKTTE
jgi:transcriptional regulator with XRE-family HTH domain